MDIVQDLLLSNFIRGASLSKRIRHIRVTKFVLRNPMFLEYFERSTASAFEVTHLDDKILAPCLDPDATLLLQAASACLSSPTR